MQKTNSRQANKEEWQSGVFLLGDDIWQDTHIYCTTMDEVMEIPVISELVICNHVENTINKMINNK